MRLGNIAEVSAGQSAPQDSKCFGTDGHPFIRAGSLEFLCSGGSLNDLEHIKPEIAARHHLKLFPRDTILFAKSGMSAKIGRVYRLAAPAYVVSHLAAIIPKEKLTPGYLLHFAIQNSPSQLIPNEAYPSIRLSEIENIEIPLPSIEDQLRISDILDKAEAIRRKRQEAINRIDNLVKSQFISNSLQTLGAAA
jgi:type I restriction enzyme S subunit